MKSVYWATGKSVPSEHTQYRRIGSEPAAATRSSPPPCLGRCRRRWSPRLRCCLPRAVRSAAARTMGLSQVLMLPCEDPLKSKREGSSPAGEALGTWAPCDRTFWHPRGPWGSRRSPSAMPRPADHLLPSSPRALALSAHGGPALSLPVASAPRPPRSKPRGLTRDKGSREPTDPLHPLLPGGFQSASYHHHPLHINCLSAHRLDLLSAELTRGLGAGGGGQRRPVFCSLLHPPPLELDLGHCRPGEIL